MRVPFGVRFFHVLFFCWRCFSISNMAHQINEDIRDKEVRLISSDGQQLGIMSSRDALAVAAKAGLDLVKIVEIKEIRMSPSIDVGDLNTKLRNANKFLAAGNRVKVTVRFRGREMAHTNIGEELLKKFAESCAEIASLDRKPKLEGRHMTILLSPKVSKEPKKDK